MNKKYTLYIGLNDKDTKTQIIDNEKAKKMVYDILFINNIEGFTIYQAYGVYKHIDNTIIEENTLKIELMFVDIETIKHIIDMLKVALNQETILLQVEELKSELI